MTIEKISNGYLLTRTDSSLSITRTHCPDLTALFQQILRIEETRYPHGEGSFFGQVFVAREKGETFTAGD